MTKSWLIQNAQIPGRSGHQQILLEDGQVKSIVPQQNTEVALDVTTFDVTGDWISLGGVDLQINGALGLAFPDLTIENALKLNHINRFLWQHGVDACLRRRCWSGVWRWNNNNGWRRRIR